MKRLLAVVLLLCITTADAQWNNTINDFYDTLHSAVITAANSQRNPIVVTSYPDGGYIIIWEDDRNSSSNKTDIYAQKYDHNGHTLWATGGIVVAGTPDNEHYTFSSNQDYRNRSFACTDSAGGFYICYSADSLNNYTWEKVTVQHIKSNGTKGLADAGNVIARSGAPNLTMAAQIIADGNRGFFLAFRQYSGNDFLHVYCYRDESGSLKYYGGGRVNENYQEQLTGAPCGIKRDVVAVGTTLGEYSIWPDGQGGCNVVMDMYGNTGTQGRMLAYNKVWRAKKDAQSRTYFRNTSGTSCPRFYNYRKGDVYILYTFKQDYQSVYCGGSGRPAYAYTNYRLISNGYAVIDNTGYSYDYPKGVNVPTNGNLNVDVVAFTTRKLVNNTVTPFYIKGIAMIAEKYDSIPYQATTYDNPDMGYNPDTPQNLNKLNVFSDTLIASGGSYPDFSMATGGSDVYVTSLLNPNGGGRYVLVQRLSVNRKAADSFAIEYNTRVLGTADKSGLTLGRELATGFGSTDMYFDLPFIKVARNGQAVFSVNESGRGDRISPIYGTELRWGAMGKPIGASVYHDSYYSMSQPVLAIDSTGSSGIIVWKDTRTSGGDDIFLQHIDKLEQLNYTPPARLTRLLPNPFGNSGANPAVLFGTSNAYTPLEVFSRMGNNNLSPILEVADDQNFGSVKAGINQNTAQIRRYNGAALLDRNYYLASDSNMTGKTISMALYFTNTEFDALKATDNSIKDPGYLEVIRQPGNNAYTPDQYSPAANEEVVTPDFWDSVAGGYRIYFKVNGTGNFFIRKLSASNHCDGNGISFTSNITGSSYRWLVNSGSGWEQLTDNAVYSGTRTATLHISNAPDSFNGYRYRCLVDASRFSNTSLLQIANIWTGAVNTQWETAGNWSCGTVPMATTHVIINSGTVTVNSAAVCASLQVSATVSINVSNGNSITITQ